MQYRPQYYPGTQQKITAPFSVLVCSCGYRTWAIFPEPRRCPKCGNMMAMVQENKNVAQAAEQIISTDEQLYQIGMLGR